MIGQNYLSLLCEITSNIWLKCVLCRMANTKVTLHIYFHWKRRTGQLIENILCHPWQFMISRMGWLEKRVFHFIFFTSIWESINSLSLMKIFISETNLSKNKRQIFDKVNIFASYQIRRALCDFLFASSPKLISVRLFTAHAFLIWLF